MGAYSGCDSCRMAWISFVTTGRALLQMRAICAWVSSGTWFLRQKSSTYLTDE